MKNIKAWTQKHSGHNTAVQSAGGFVYLLCLDCGVCVTVDEVDAGLPVEVDDAN